MPHDNTKPPEGTVETAMDMQAALATSPERFLPQNIPDSKFRDLLVVAWGLATPGADVDIRPLIEYVADALNSRLSFQPALPSNQSIERLQQPELDREAWSDALWWAALALTAEWGVREGFTGPHRFDMENYDFHSQQVWGAPKVPGAMVRSAAPGNPLVESLGAAMDAVFNPDEPAAGCPFCDKSALFRDVAAIQDAIAQADAATGYNPSDDEQASWRLCGAIVALGLSEHYRASSSEIREHCYHVVHGTVNAAQHRFARDQLVKPCGDWCKPEMVLYESTQWAAVFARVLDTKAEDLIREGHINNEEVAVLYAATIELMALACDSYDPVHIGHSVCHMLMDGHAPNPACH
jgi:hypothetical protein